MRRLAALFALSLALTGCASLHRIKSGDMSSDTALVITDVMPK